VDAGKSTMMGHLLYLLGEIDEKTIKKFVDPLSTFHAT
jgi:translation elongation factor EF-1alpha